MSREKKRKSKKIMPLGEVRRALGLYSSLSIRDRLAILARLIFCARPIMRVLKQHLPKRGLVLDLGCGYGFISHLVSTESPDMAVMGIDASSRRIRAARRSIDHKGNIEFHVADLKKAPIPQCDAVMLIDILCMLPYEVQERLLTRCYERLCDGGVLVVKDTCKSPYWKYAYVYVEDLLKAKLRVFGKEIEHSLCYWNVHNFLKLLGSIGFHTTMIPLESRLPYPGVFYICKKQVQQGFQER
ncbi:class I SAM-dependent methyltransferase [Candidatus Poribacteria bacterium]